MEIVFATSQTSVADREQPYLELIISKLRAENFADECRIELADFQRFFSCVFRKGNTWSVPFKINVMHLKTLSEDITPLKKASEKKEEAN